MTSRRSPPRSIDPHKTDFVLPLAPQVVRILKEQIAELEEWGPVDYLWPSSTKGSRVGGPQAPHITNMTMLRYLQRGMGLKATVHGFRASFKTWADDQFVEGSEATPKYHAHAVEFCLAHKAGSWVEQAYRRRMMFEARVVIMRDWAKRTGIPRVSHCVLAYINLLLVNRFVTARGCADRQRRRQTPDAIRTRLDDEISAIAEAFAKLKVRTPGSKVVGAKADSDAEATSREIAG